MIPRFLYKSEKKKKEKKEVFNQSQERLFCTNHQQAQFIQFLSLFVMILFINLAKTWK